MKFEKQNIATSFQLTYTFLGLFETLVDIYTINQYSNYLCLRLVSYYQII